MGVNLDKVQEEIVKSEDKKIVVVAASGSGKTAVSTERVRYLIEEKGVSPEGIVFITYTNAAAGEMKDRLQDVENIGDAFIGTIHSFANKVYRQSGLTYGLYTDEAKIMLAKEIINKYLLSDQMFNNLTVDRFTAYMEEERKIARGELDVEDVSPSTFFSRPEYSDWIDLERVLEFERKKKNLITFDELITKTKEYYATLGATIEHVLVDEFQDVSKLEYEFVEGLNGENTLYVGDDFQAIFSFKGGDVNIIKEAVKKPDVKVFKLENNYRSGKKILDLADTVINQVDSRIRKTIVPKAGIDGEVVIDSKDRVKHYLDQIRKTGNYNDWFILCRTNKDVNLLAGMLRDANVPVDTFKRGGMDTKDLEEQLSLPSVKVLTVHVSKGLENKNVIVYGKFPVKLPSWWRNDEEERRVLYVALTRAKQKVILLN